MIRKIKMFLISKINTSPNFKKNILRLVDFYYEYIPIFVGNFTRIPAYLIHILNSKVIAKPGTLSFDGGAFNPGAFLLDVNEIILLAKSQILPWYKARGNKRKFYLEGYPVVFLLDKKSLNARESYILKNLIGFPQDKDFALEDFRIFIWKGQKMLNHSFIIKRNVDVFIGQTAVLSALSVLNHEQKKITFCAFPKLDFPIQKFEKNWVYKENKEQLLLFYSLNPYRVLMLDNEEDFTFKTILNENFEKLSNPGGFGTMVSFSTNPIDFDDKYWLIIIHQIKYNVTGRCYFHWGVLIDKYTFLPVKITIKPIFSGMGARGRVPGIRYISSILKTGNEILFFAGEGDVYVTVTKKSINEINKLWKLI